MGLPPAGEGLRFGLLGPVEVWDDDGRQLRVASSKQRVVLATLLLRPGVDISVDALVHAVWGDHCPAHPRQALHLHVARLRDKLRRGGLEGAIVTGGDGYRADVSADRVDLGRFRLLIEQAERHAGEGALSDEAAALAEAVDLWRGEPLGDVASEVLHLDVVPELREIRLDALERHLAAEVRCGRSAAVVPRLAALTAQHPVRERFWTILMTALQHSGRRADALEAYHAARRHLAEELGVDPGPELQAQHLAVLGGRPNAGVPAPTTTVAFHTPRQLPPAAPGFVGRTTALAQLDAVLAPESDGDPRPVARSVVISGTAGVGKTSLATQWAHRVADNFPDGQLWVNLRGYDPGQAVAPDQALRRLLHGLGVPDPEIPPDLDDQVGLYRSLMDGRRALVLLDNARSAEQVRPLLPGGAGTLTLVTSRNRLAGLSTSHGTLPVLLDLLNRQEGRDLLIARVGAERALGQATSVDQIVALCARLPLAITIAAARAANRPTVGLPTLAAQMRAAKGGLDPFTGQDVATEIRAVFSWSYDALDPGAARLFRLLSEHPGPDISRAAAASLAGVDPGTAESLLHQLSDAHLLTEPAPERYAFHDLLRAYALEQVRERESDSDRDAARRRLVDHYVHTSVLASGRLLTWEAIRADPPPPDVIVEAFDNHRQALAWYDTELPVLLAVVRRAAQDHLATQTCRLAWTLAEYLYRRGRWHDWATVERTALHAAIRDGGDAEQARSHRELARAYARLGRVADAETHCRRAIQLSGQLGDIVGVATTHRIYGIICEGMGQHEEALSHDRTALHLFEAAGHVVGQARARNAIAVSLDLLGNHDEAVRHCERAIPFLRGAQDLQGLAATWDTLGLAHHHLGEYREAIDCYTESLSLFRDLGDRFKETDALTHLGDTHLANGDVTTAADVWHTAVAQLTSLRNHEAARIVRTRLTAIRFTRPYLGSPTPATQRQPAGKSQRQRTGLLTTEPTSRSAE